MEDILKGAIAVVIVVCVYFGYEQITGQNHPAYSNEQVSEWCRDGLSTILDNVSGIEDLNIFKAAAGALGLGSCVGVINNYESSP